MQEIATKPASAAVELKDARLFREACYVDGQWIQAKSGAAIIRKLINPYMNPIAVSRSGSTATGGLVVQSLWWWNGFLDRGRDLRRL